MMTTTGVAEEIVAHLSPGERRAVLRCAVVTLFDTAMYDAALMPDRSADDPDIPALQRGGLVEELALTPAAPVAEPTAADRRYRVVPGLREAAWAAWFTGEPAHRRRTAPPALRAVAARVEQHCATTAQDVERLRALLLVDQERARAWFDEAFRDCDQRFDLTGCTNLVHVLGEPSRLPFVGPELAAEGERQRRYLTARDLWRTAYLGSEPSRYLSRPDLEEQMERLLADDGPRLMRLHGSGGYGKSTLLRWFLARCCVPNRVPCALVDLDEPTDSVNATKHPWLLLLEIAHQLNGQMADTPFEHLLSDYGQYRPLLVAQPSIAARAGSASTLGTRTADVDAREVANLFLDALADAPPQPVVIVIDTFEEAMLRRPDDTRALVGLLRKVGAARHIRLIVAGRLNTTEAELADGYLGQVVFLEVPQFTREQSIEYLGRRRITRAELVDPIVRRARGVPWQLALWGDVVDRYPGLTPEQLDQLQPEIAWVVDRIVGRLPGLLQWLVRYGVVPRRLSRDFAQRVLLPRMARALTGSPDDDPTRDRRPPGAVPVFPTGLSVPATEAEFAELWQQLTRYAATTSWMSLAPGDEDAVVFHVELREPLRQLVADQPVGALLHGDAIRYYEQLAAAEENRWPSWTREAIYHRFRLDGADGARYWRGAVTAARIRGLKSEAVVEIAGELLCPDYFDEHGAARTDDSGAPLVDGRTLAAAHAERAWALSRTALRLRLPGGHSTWSRIESGLAAADRLPDDPDSQPRRNAARAALELARGRPAAAVALVEPALADFDLVPVDRCVALLLLAEAHRAAGEPEKAQQALLAASQVADRLADLEVSARAAGALAEDVALLGRLDEADRGLRRAIGKRPLIADDPDLRRIRVQIALAIGRPASALRLAVDPTDPLRAEARIALGDPADAVAICDAALAGTGEPERQASLLLLRARARAALLDVDRAVDDAMLAREHYVELGDAEGAGLCTVLAADVMLHGVGSLREARQYLDEGSRLTLEPGRPAWTAGRLLRAELEHRHGDQEAATAAAAEAVARVAASGDRRRIVDAALRARTVAPELEPLVTDLLTEHLPRITPASARLTALSALPQCPSWRWGERLLALTMSGPAGPGGARTDDTARQDLQLAELLRIAGRTAEAGARLDAGTSGLASAPLAGWHWLRAEARIGPTDAAEHPVASRLVDHEEHPLLAAAQALALAERRLDRGGPVDDLLERAERWMKRATARTTEWHAQLADLSRIVAERNRQPDAARRMTLVAMATRRELGERHAERASIELEADRPAAAERTAQRGVTVRAELRPDGTITLSSESGSITVPDADGLLAGLRDTRKSPLVRWVRDRCMMLHDNKSMFVALDALLPAPEPGAELDLRLPAEPPLAQLPWELAALQGEPVADHPGIGALYRAPEPELLARTGVRLLQEALTAAGTTPGPIDGLHGPDTTRALETFQRRNGIFDDGIAGVRTWRALRAATGGGPRSVLVVRRDLRPPRGAAPLEEAYAQFGWQVQTVDSEQLTHIGEAGASGPVDVVHVHATMQVIGSTPYLGFGVGSGARSGPEAVPCTVLDSAVRRLARLGSTPLVVLDIVGTAKFDTETVRQLLLRNDFAAQMLALGRCYAVLATGLAPQQRAVEAQQRLLGAATAATTAADLANRLRLNLVKGRGPAAVLPWATTALFAAVAPELMPTLNRSSSHSS